MRNLTLRADWNDFSLFDDYEASPVAADCIPPELRNQLSGWNNDYRPLIALSPAERTAPTTADKIAELDAVGRRLAGELKAIFPDATLRYASEGRGETGILGVAV
jgi:hypothetical protein